MFSRDFLNICLALVLIGEADGKYESNVCSNNELDSTGDLFRIDLNDHQKEQFAAPSNSSHKLISACDNPRMTLSSGGSTFFRSEEFVITSMIKFDCNQPISVQFQWTVKICTTSCSNAIEFDENIVTTSTELHIPSRTLAYGIYQIEFQMTIIGSLESTISQSIYIQIIPSPITSNLLPFGTSMITIGHEQDLTFNPGLFSIDPDEDTFDSSDWIYNYSYRFNKKQTEINASNSPLTIPGKTFQPNRIYQFIVSMKNRRNPARQATGYARVRIAGLTPRPIISISTNSKRINPTTPLTLSSNCIGNCTNIESITWRIYSESMNLSYDKKSSNFTVPKQLFLNNPQIKNWKFEVIYSFPSTKGISSLNIIVNQPPINGSCLISPSIDSATDTSFTISCADWFDEDGIKDYLVYVWTSDHSKKIFIGYSSNSNFEIRLPSSSLNVIVAIRDRFDSITEYNLTARVTQTDEFTDLSNKFKIGNQNSINQLIIQICQELNQKNNELIDQAVQNGIPLSNISISSLDDQSPSPLSSTKTTMKQSALLEFTRQLNFYAKLREDLTIELIQLPITTLNTIKLQASTLAQLTKATNQLTRLTVTNAANRCYRLTRALFSTPSNIAFEDLQIVATALIECASNVLTAVNGPLQERTIVLDLDSTRNADQSDLIINENSYHQKQTANRIIHQFNEIISKLTVMLSVHLTIGQKLTIHTSQTILSLEIDVSTQKIIRSMTQPLAPFGNSKVSANTHVSRLVSLSIVDENANELPVHANDSHPIEIIIPRDPNRVVPSMILQNVTSIDSTLHQQLFNLHYVNLSSHSTSLSSSLHIEIQPIDIHVAYLFIYKFDRIPQLNSSLTDIDGWTILSNDGIYHYFLDNQQTQNHRSLIFGLRELNSSEINVKVHSPPIVDQRSNFTTNYNLRIYSSGCYYLDENNQWQDDGVRVGSQTNHNQTQCLSTHLTTFAGGYLVLPEPVNWQYIFANADFARNKTIYSTVITVTIIYLLLVIFARFKDKKDLEKLGVTPLEDNDPSDGYNYQILVFTGHRKESHTKSKVQFILAGDQDQTKVRLFSDPKRNIFEQGGIDAFVMSVPKSLGPLTYFHIWHDNSGKGSSASWFLKYIVVRDLQTMNTFYFICQRWLAVEKDDGQIERVLPAASDTEKTQFSYLLSKQAYHSVSDGHLWFSIFSRPPSNQFTRVQRCTCCFVLFFLSMFLNIMYYDLSNQAKSNNSTNVLSIGPIVIAKEQIAIGVAVEILALFPSLLVVQMFRRLRPRGVVINKKKRGFTFPWWCMFIAYGLCVILVGVSMFFIIVRGIEFGDVKTQQWLASILTGFFSSVLLTQPIKIVTLAIFFACFCRKSDKDREADEYLIEIDDNDEYLHQRRTKEFYAIYHPTIEPNRLNQYEINHARDQRMKEVHMWTFVSEAGVYIVFIVLLFVITYSNRTAAPFLQVQHLENDFKFKNVLTITDYYRWLNRTFVKRLRAQAWYNGDPPRYLSGYMNDTSNRLIGWATMRQVRVRSEPCKLKTFNLSCELDFRLSNEERDSFLIAWENVTTSKGNSTLEKAFQYQSKEELDTYTIVGNHARYPPGGYVYEFRGRISEIYSNLSALHENNWIDSQTRAVIIQFNLYNPNVQLFTSVLILTEILSTGGLHIKLRFEPILFYVSSTIVLIVLYLVLIIYFMVVEIQKLFRLKRKYFTQFWVIIELGIIVCSWMGVALFILRTKECSRIGDIFAKTNGYAYVNLQYLTYLNDFLQFMYAYCCFFGTIKLLRLFRFNSRVYFFFDTLKLASKELLGFATMFSIVFFGYMCLFYLLFCSKFFQASSLIQTAGMLFEMTLMKFDAHELIDADAILGPVAFSLFIFIVVFVCFSMFLTILNESFAKARENCANDEEIYTFMWKRILRITGLKKQTKSEGVEEYDAMMRKQYVDSFQLLDKRVDELLHIFNRIYTDQVETKQ